MRLALALVNEQRDKQTISSKYIAYYLKSKNDILRTRRKKNYFDRTLHKTFRRVGLSSNLSLHGRCYL